MQILWKPADLSIVDVTHGGKRRELAGISVVVVIPRDLILSSTFPSVFLLYQHYCKCDLLRVSHVLDLAMLISKLFFRPFDPLSIVARSVCVVMESSKAIL